MIGGVFITGCSIMIISVDSLRKQKKTLLVSARNPCGFTLSRGCFLFARNWQKMRVYVLVSKRSTGAHTCVRYLSPPLVHPEPKQWQAGEESKAETKFFNLFTSDGTFHFSRQNDREIIILVKVCVFFLPSSVVQPNA